MYSVLAGKVGMLRLVHFWDAVGWTETNDHFREDAEIDYGEGEGEDHVVGALASADCLHYLLY